MIIAQYKDIVYLVAKCIITEYVFGILTSFILVFSQGMINERT